MDPDLTSVSKHAVPKVSYRVRRRRYSDAAWLLHHNDRYQLDALTDSIWLACEESLTIEQIIERVAAEHSLPLDEAIAATVYTLEQFRGLGFLEYEGGREAEATCDAAAQGG